MIGARAKSGEAITDRSSSRMGSAFGISAGPVRGGGLVSSPSMAASLVSLISPDR
jgi:hypothetical protein